MFRFLSDSASTFFVIETLIITVIKTKLLNPEKLSKMIELVGLKKRKTTKDLAVATLVAALPRCGWRDPKSAPATTHYRWDCLDDCWQWILHHSPAGFKETATDDQLRGGRAYIEAYVRDRSPPGWAEGDAGWNEGAARGLVSQVLS